MNYNLPGLTIEQITNLFLYGQPTTPVDLIDESLIRGPEALPRQPASTSVTLNAATYMSTGPGRYAHAAMSELVNDFMQSRIMPATGVRQVLTAADFVFAYDETKRSLSYQQYNYGEGVSTTDFKSRVYIFGSTPFAIANDAEFIVEADGTRHIKKFAILPRSDNFDFESGNPATDFINPTLRELIDPSKIGRRVDILFDAVSLNQIPRVDYTQADYTYDTAHALDNYTGPGFVSAGLIIPSIVNTLWDSGVTKFLDAEGRAIYYGTNNRDALDELAFLNRIVDSDLRQALQTKGIAIVAGEGNDTLTGGSRGDALYGGAGADTLNGGNGNDELHGGIDDDIINGGSDSDTAIGGGGDDQIKGESGNDTLWGDEAESGIGASVYAGRKYFGKDTLEGGEGDDKLYGGAGDDKLKGGDDNDTLYGDGQDESDATRTGDDTLVGGDGRDTLYGGLGDDKLYGDQESETSEEIFGYADTLYGGNGKDKLYGGSGEDNLYGGAGDDKLKGGDDNDTLYGDGQDENDTTRTGSDTLVGGYGRDTLYGGLGDDKLYGDQESDTSEEAFGYADTLHGGRGKDKLYGGSGDDKLNGGEGDDLLKGGDGRDTLKGDAGFDSYQADRQDTITDTDGKGEVKLGEQKLGLATRKKGEKIYKDDNGNKYLLEDGLLTINGGLKITDFTNGDLGIVLKEKDLDPIKKKFDAAKEIPSPITLDLNGDGVQTTALAAGAHFDHADDGFAEQTGWVSQGDGLLVRDLDGNGTIDSGKELFGSETLLTTGANQGKKAANGFEALRELDTNGNSKIDAGDTNFDSLRIWQDANSNAVTDDGELLTLAEASVQSINVGYTAGTWVDAQSNAHLQLGSYTTTEGLNRAADDVWFQTDNTYSIATQELDVPADIAALPNASGYGKVRDLDQAMVRDTTGRLQTLVAQFAGAATAEERQALLQPLIYEWAGVTGVAIDSRAPNRYYGNVIGDARKLEALEEFMGQEWVGVWCWGEADPNPHGRAAPVLLQAWAELSERIYAELVSTSFLKPLVDEVRYYRNEGDATVHIDLAAVVPALTDAVNANRSAGKELLVDFLRVLKDNDSLGAIDLLAFRTSLTPMGEDVLSTLNSAFGVSGTNSNDYLLDDDNAHSLLGVGGKDVLIGNGGDDLLDGGSGDDDLDGGGGNDDLYGGRGNDQLYGSSGADTYHFSRSDGQDIIHDNYLETNWIDIDNLSLSELTFRRVGADLHIGFQSSASDEIVLAGFVKNGVLQSNLSVRRSDGDTRIFDTSVLTQLMLEIEVVQGTSHADTIVAPEGEDFVFAWDGNDTVNGGAGADDIHGGNDNDQLAGGSGNDGLYGDAGEDTLAGNDGNDLVDGGTGADLMAGGQGDDSYVVDDIGDVIAEAAGEGADAVAASASITLSANVENATLTGTADINATGNAADNLLMGNAGANTLMGMAGNDDIRGGEGDDFLSGGTGFDRLQGGAGDDAIDGGDGSDQLSGGDGNDTIFGGAGSDLLEGDAGADVLAGGASDDLLDGGSGDDTMSGGQGDDAYIVDDAGDVLVELAGEGVDVVTSSVRITLSENVENVLLVGDAPINATGNAEANIMLGSVGYNSLYGMGGDDELRGGEGGDILDGGSGNDLLDGGTGFDTMAGGAGDDVYWLDRVEDVVIEHADEGIDTIHVAASYTLTSNVENLVLESDGGYVDGTGNELANQLAGNEYDNRLDGGEGADTLTGGDSNDTYVVDNAGDMVVEAANANAGNADQVISSIDYTLTDNVENLALSQGSTALLGTGNALDNTIIGNSLDNQLFGGAGVDLLDGSAGTDLMAGGTGNDTYVVDNVGDTVFENAGEGIDLVLAHADHTLSANVENLTIVATWDDSIGDYMSLTGTGNDADNVMTGDYSNDTLYGIGGDDTLNGLYGNDTLYGGAGNDLLEAAGNGFNQWTDETDLLAGGTGDDVYRIDSAYDQIIEDADGGTDTVYSYSTYTALSANVENLVIYGDYQDDYDYVSWRQFDADGNDLDNTILGNDANNALSGYEGNDNIDGAAGNDAIYGGDRNDILFGGADALHVGSGGGPLLLLRAAGPMSLSSVSDGYDGAEGSVQLARNNDYLDGGAGDDQIDGGSGDDTLLGGDGNDALYGGDNRSALLDPQLADQAVDGVRNLMKNGVPAQRTLDLLIATFGLSQDSASLDAGYFAYPAWQLSATPGEPAIPTPLYIQDWHEGEPQPSEALYVQPDGSVTWEGGGAFQDYELAYWNPTRDVTWEDLASQYGVRTNTDGADASAYIAVTATFPVPLDVAEGEVMDEYRTVYWPRDTLPGDTAWMFEALSHRGMDTLDGGAGDDTLDGGGGDDTLLGGDGADTLYGGDDQTFDVVVDGFQGEVVMDLGTFAASNNDYLDGGAGIDTLIGATGDDTYVVDGVATVNPDGREVVLDLCDSESRFGMDVAPVNNWLADRVVELAGQGNDTVYSTASIDLSGQEIETVNLLDGGPVADIDARTSDGSQVLNGNSGRNTLDGGAGADVMTGGLGDDTYYVEDAGDVFVELADEGMDTVRTSLDGYTLGSDFENLVLEGGALAGSGNELDNIVIGNGLDNALDGGDGNDTLAGWRGNDTLRGGAGADIYAFGRGDGQDVVMDTEGMGELHFGDGITIADLHFVSRGNDLVIELYQGGIKTTDQITLQGWANSPERISAIAFCDAPTVVLDESLINRAPVAVADVAQVTEDLAVQASGNVLANDNDPDAGQVLAVSNPGTYAGLYGSLVLGGDGGYTYQLNNALAEVQALAAGQILSEQFSYTVQDNAGSPLTAGSTLSITITGSNDGPITAVELASVGEDGVLMAGGNVLANDRDIDNGDVLHVASTGSRAGAYGTLNLAADGSYAYNLNNTSTAVQSLRRGQTVTETFAYSATDGLANAASNLVVTVTGSNDGPKATADVASVAEDGVLIASGNVLANDSDIDVGDTLTVAAPATLQGTYGNLVLAANGSYTYTLNNTSTAVQGLRSGQQVSDSFAYSASDGLATSAGNLVVTVTGSNDGPRVVADVAAVGEDGLLVTTGNVLANDSDVDTGDVLSVASPGTLQGTYGSLALTANGSYTYTLNNAGAAVQSLAQGQIVVDQFSYTARDNAGNPLSATTQLSVTVTGANDAPIVVTPIADQSGREGQAFNFAVAATAFKDIDQDDTLSYSARLVDANGIAQTLPGWLSFNATTRTFTGTLDSTSGGTYTLRVIATDRQGASASDDFELTVADDCSTSNGTVINGRDCYNDVLNGTACDDIINGKSGNDKLYGNGGNDRLDGGTGSDVLDGGAGNDTLVFGADTEWGGNDCYDPATSTNVGSPGVAGSNTQVDIDGHARSLDVFEGGAGIDTLLGSNCDDAILLDDGSTGTGAGARIKNIEVISGGWGDDVINLTSIRYAYGDVTLTGGTGDDILWAGAGNDVLQGNEDRDTLDGGAGNDLLQGGTGDDFLNGRKGFGNDINQGQNGNDTITDMAGLNLLDGGAGQDTMTDGDAASFFFGGKQNDTITTGKGADLIAFNRGDGADTIYLGAESAVSDTLSLGMGIKYASLKFKKSGNDLILDMGTVNSVSDKMTFKNWYSSASNRTVAELQVMTAGGDYDANSSDKTRNKQVEVFDFTKLVQKFDAARAANSSNANGWAMMNSMLDAHLQGSNTQALGGDLAFQYGTTGSLAGIGLGAAQASLAAGTDWQNLQNRTQLEQGSVRLV